MAGPEKIDHNPALVPPLQPTGPAQAPDKSTRTEDGKSFQEVLRSKVASTVAPETSEKKVEGEEFSVRFSAHAAARLKQRGIEMDDARLMRLEQAVDMAAAKGGKDALVMMDDTAMVVSVTNRTVITALGREQAQHNVFTNIDSAVIA